MLVTKAALYHVDHDGRSVFDELVVAVPTDKECLTVGAGFHWAGNDYAITAIVANVALAVRQ